MPFISTHTKNVFDNDGSVSISAVGDLYIGKPLQHEAAPTFLQAVNRFREADVRFGNLEVQLIPSDIPGAAQAAGAWAGAPEELASSVAWLGVNAVSTANNHAGDYGAPGLHSTHARLKQLSIPYCGTGDSLQAARQPMYIETAGGKVAILGVSSSFMPHARAGRQHSDMQGRAGLSPLRFGTHYHIDAQAFRELERILLNIPVGDGHRERPLARNESKDNRASLSFFGREFVQSDHFEVESWPAQADVNDIVAEIEKAKAEADWVIVSMHTHEFDSTAEEPAGFARTFTQSCISAGADAVLCHGHHGVRGVELQDGKPIFHGLGPFVFQPYLFPRQPSDFYEAYDMPDASLEATYAARREAAGFFNHREHWEAMLIQLQFRHGREPDFQIYPISLWPPGNSQPDGLPHLVQGASGEHILEKIRLLSAKLGTTLSLDHQLGILRSTAAQLSSQNHTNHL